jgi:hypothetical protein
LFKRVACGATLEEPLNLSEETFQRNLCVLKLVGRGAAKVEREERVYEREVERERRREKGGERRKERMEGACAYMYSFPCGLWRLVVYTRRERRA